MLAEVAGLAEPPFTVGFAAETDDVEANARGKLERKRLDLIAANRVGVPETGFGTADSALTIYWSGGERALGCLPPCARRPQDQDHGRRR